MKTVALVLLFVIYFAECRKVVPPINKNANIDFINMEAGGGVRPGANTAKAPPSSPVNASPAKPAPGPISAPAAPTPKPVPVTPKPVPVPAKPAQPQPSLVNPPSPTQIHPKPVNPAPAAHPVTTPGPGTVKQLVNFYDSQGKASPIRPYSYSQAVKQG